MAGTGDAAYLPGIYARLRNDLPYDIAIRLP